VECALRAIPPCVAPRTGRVCTTVIQQLADLLARSEPGMAQGEGVAAKICGLSSETSVRAAVAGGADYLGFVFYPPSRRAVSPAEAGRLCAAVPVRVARVGLFVDADDATIDAVLAAAPIDILQFHGGETPERVANAKARFGRPVMKAVAVAGAADLAAAARYEAVADLLLFDAKPPPRPGALPGGNGVAFDWELLSGRRWRRPWLLSGGLTAELLPQAVRLSGAQAVDVSSGVESRPGIKDLDKIREFLAAARTL
jgi:phosphoribosylanthranilate isomerase